MFFPLNIETLKRVGKTIVKINIEITPGHNLHIICSAKIIPVFWVISYKLCIFQQQLSSTANQMLLCFKLYQ